MEPRERSLFVCSGGFLTQTGLRGILQAAGWRVRVGYPGQGDDRAIGVWGQKPVSTRGRMLSRLSGADLITLEDGFLRSVYPGDAGVPPISIVMDDVGIYYDARSPSRLEAMLQNGCAEQEDMDRARRGIALLRESRLSKYTPPVAPGTLDAGYILVVDQTAGDASIPGALADMRAFRRMLEAARAENPGKRIVLKSHPDVIAGRKRGHFSTGDLSDSDVLLATEINPWDALEGADAVYTVSSQLGYEALLAQKPVRCFGAPFYAGWGLTGDEITVRRRTARPSVEALFAACHLAYPIYHDPWRRRICRFEDAVAILKCLVEAEYAPAEVSGEVFGGVRL